MLRRVAVVRTDYIVFLRSVRRLLVTAEVVASSSILVTLVMEALLSSETLVLTRATRLTSQKTAFFNSGLGLLVFSSVYLLIHGMVHASCTR
jgi:hypothetical protein